MSVKQHKCPQMEEIFKRDNTHLMSGHAFNEIIKYEGDEVWYATDDHNGTVIFFCPFCGEHL